MCKSGYISKRQPSSLVNKIQYHHQRQIIFLHKKPNKCVVTRSEQNQGIEIPEHNWNWKNSGSKKDQTVNRFSVYEQNSVFAGSNSFQFKFSNINFIFMIF
jgi:hypothetical protein